MQKLSLEVLLLVLNVLLHIKVRDSAQRYQYLLDFVEAKVLLELLQAHVEVLNGLLLTHRVEYIVLHAHQRTQPH
jgi:hypothetical protein